MPQYYLMIFMLTTGLQIKFINAPVLKVVAKGQHTHLFHKMKFAGAVKVENGGKGPRMTIEEILVFEERVVITEFHDRFVSVALAESAQASMRESL